MKPLLKNVDYNPQDLVGEVVKITNNHMEFVVGSKVGCDFISHKDSKWTAEIGYLHYLNVGTKWLILKVRGEDRDTAAALIANFTDPLYNLWIPLDEFERSARLLG